MKPWKTLFVYCVPETYAPEETTELLRPCGVNLYTVYTDNGARSFSIDLDKTSTASNLTPIHLEPFDPTTFYHGVAYHIPHGASKCAGFLFAHVASNPDLSFIELRGLADVINADTFVELTANGEKHPAILYVDRELEDTSIVCRVYFEKGLFAKGGVLELQIQNPLQYGLRMNFVETFGDYVTLVNLVKKG